MPNRHQSSIARTHPATCTFALVLTLAAVVVALIASHTAYAAEHPDIASGTSGTCTWTISAKGKLTVSPTEGDTGTLGTWGNYTSSPWYEYRSSIQSVAFAGTVKALTCEGMFYDCTNLISVNLTGLDTSDVTSMYLMFCNCKIIKELDLRSLATTNVQNLTALLKDCWALQRVNLPNTGTPSAKWFDMMFSGCEHLEYIDLSVLDTSSAESMAGMFGRCVRLRNIDASGFDTRNVTTMNGMFSGCHALRTLDLHNFETGKVQNMGWMFQDCHKLTWLDLSSFDTFSANTMQGMFDCCASLTFLDLSSFDTWAVTDMRRMFACCSALKTIFVHNPSSVDDAGWDTDKVTQSAEMFAGCDALVGSNGTAYNAEHVDMEYARVDSAGAPGYLSPYQPNIASGESGSCNWSISAQGALSVAPKSGENGTLADFRSPEDVPWHAYSDQIDSCLFVNTVKTGDCAGLFCGCANLTKLDLSGLDTGESTDMSRMFEGCATLTELDVSALDTRAARSMTAMFKGCAELTGLALVGFNTQRVTDTSFMFSGCEKLQSLTFGQFDTAAVGSMSDMFANCKKVRQLDLTSFDTALTYDMSHMFSGCTALESICIGNSWTPANVTVSEGMFADCVALTGANGTRYNASHTNAGHARVDSAGTPGYLSPAENANIASGIAGTCYWFIDSGGSLTIQPLEGEFGQLPDFEKDMPPWLNYREQIASIRVVRTVQTPTCFNMFRFCQNVTTADLAGLDTSQVQSMMGMFDNCSKLTSLDLSGLDITSVMSMHMMFYECEKLADLKLPSTGAPGLRSISNMFDRCGKLERIDLSVFGYVEIVDLSHAFQGCKNLVEVDLSTLVTTKTQQVAAAFHNCNMLNKVTVGNTWNLTSPETQSDQMFYGCTSIVGANGTAYDPNHINAEYARIDTADAPGYFWPKEPSTGDNDDKGNDDKPGNSSGDNTSNNTGQDVGESGGSSTDELSSSQNSNADSAAVANVGNNANLEPSASKAQTATGGALASARVVLSKDVFAYNGKACMPKVTVTLNDKILVSGRDYSVSFPKGRKSVGTYKVTIHGKPPYYGSTTARFRIVPKASKLKSLKAKKNSDGTFGFVAKWAKVKGAFDGYELRWSTAKAFSKAERFKCSKRSKTSKTTSAALRVRHKAWRGKKIYVQVRTFKKAEGKTYYSAWSKAKAVRMKR